MAELAAQSCRWATGLPTYVIGNDIYSKYYELQTPHFLKLHLFDELPHASTVLYFDSDSIFLRKVSFAEFFDIPEFVCVRDRSNAWSLRDSANISVPLDQYFNSGFFIANRRHHKPLIEEARRLSQCLGEQYLFDQTALNLARYTLRTPTKFLPREFNIVQFRDEDYSSRAVLAHFNGLCQKSMEEIEQKFAYWGPEHRTARWFRTLRKSIKETLISAKNLFSNQR